MLPFTGCTLVVVELIWAPTLAPSWPQWSDVWVAGHPDMGQASPVDELVTVGLRSPVFLSDFEQDGWSQLLHLDGEVSG